METDGCLSVGVGMDKYLPGFRLFSSEGLRPRSSRAGVGAGVGAGQPEGRLALSHDGAPLYARTLPARHVCQAPFSTLGSGQGTSLRESN